MAHRSLGKRMKAIIPAGGLGKGDANLFPRILAFGRYPSHPTQEKGCVPFYPFYRPQLNQQLVALQAAQQRFARIQFSEAKPYLMVSGTNFAWILAR